MTARERIWQQLHELFEADDGSLPEFVLSGLTPLGLVAGYARLTAGACLVSSDATVYDRQKGVAVPLAATVDPAGGVVRGNFDPFHAVFGRIRTSATILPDIGLGVFPDHLILDYRMGVEWTPSAVEALLHLLAELARSSPASRVALEDGARRDWSERFERAWSEMGLAQ